MNDHIRAMQEVLRQLLSSFSKKIGLKMAKVIHL